MATEVQQRPYAGIQRPLRGSRISTFYPVKSLPALSSLDSAFQLQEYISLLIRLDVHDVEAITSLPGINNKSGGKDKDKAKTSVEKEVEDGSSITLGSSSDGEKSGEEKEVSVDEACWIYEQLRRLAQDLTHPLITTLQQECSRNTCPEMKAGEWLYLCVAHGTEGAMEQCCAIDYILHTLDSATALLNSPRAFPSRLQIPTASHRHFSSLARRLGRIFAHAYFHHREAFEQAEAESSLYARFLALTGKFDLVPSEFLVIPSGSHFFGSNDNHDEDETGNGSEQYVGSSGSGSGFGLREVKLGTSYDPRRSQGTSVGGGGGAGGGGGGQQHQLPSSFQEEFPDVPRTRRLPQQYQQYQQLHQTAATHHPLQPHHHQFQSQSQSGSGSGQHHNLHHHHHQPAPQQQQQQSQHGQQEFPTLSGTESPRRTGRNRTHTMVLSESSSLVDDLAKAAAAARAEEEKEKEKETERLRKEGEEREARAREEAEREEREKSEAEEIAKREAEETDEKDVSEEEAEGDSEGSDVEELQAEEEGPSDDEEGLATVTEESVDAVTTSTAEDDTDASPSVATEVDIGESATLEKGGDEITNGEHDVEAEVSTEDTTEAEEDGEAHSGSSPEKDLGTESNTGESESETREEETEVPEKENEEDEGTT